MDIRSAAVIVANIIDRLAVSGAGYKLEGAVTDREIEALIALAAMGGHIAQKPRTTQLDGSSNQTLGI